MDTKESIAKEVKDLYQEGVELAQAFQKEDEKRTFHMTIRLGIPSL